MTDTIADWQALAACSAADADLFFPERDTPAETIAEAKALCAGCPVRQACLDHAMKTNERNAICGGMTVEEREHLLNPAAPMDKFQSRRFDNKSARAIAVKRGADLLVWLVRAQMPVEEAAKRLQATPRAVYQAFVMLVPAAKSADRPAPSVIEMRLAENAETMRTLERIGRTHQSIGEAVGTSQSIVSACLSVLGQRDAAAARLARKGEDPIVRMQAAEKRVRLESKAGLTVQDVIDVAGRRIRAMQAEEKTQRQIAQELGFNRETVRKACQVLNGGREAALLTKNEIGAAA